MEGGLIEMIFAPGNKLIVECANEKMVVNRHQSVVEDLEGAYLVLQAPLVDGVPVTFRESQELTLRRLEEEKQEAYVTNVFVIDVRQSKVPLLVCSKPEKIDRTSLRRFCRFPVSLPCKYKFPDRDEVVSGKINDLSMTGCYVLFEPNSQVKAGSILELLVSMPGEGSELALKGEVIRVDASVQGENSLSGLAFDYKDLNERERETLYYYIFQLQLTSDSILGSGLELEDA